MVQSSQTKVVASPHFSKFETPSPSLKKEKKKGLQEVWKQNQPMGYGGESNIFFGTMGYGAESNYPGPVSSSRVLAFQVYQAHIIWAQSTILALIIWAQSTIVVLIFLLRQVKPNESKYFCSFFQALPNCTRKSWSSLLFYVILASWVSQFIVGNMFCFLKRP